MRPSRKEGDRMDFRHGSVEGERASLARKIRHDALSFDLGEGWRLSSHREHPRFPLAPFYVDLKELLFGDPQFLWDAAGLIVGEFQDLWKDVDRLSCVPLGGIPLMTVVGMRLTMPLLVPDFKNNLLEGGGSPGESVVLFEDVRTTGGSLDQGIRFHEDRGIRVVRAVVWLDRGFEEGSPVRGVQVSSVFCWGELLTFLREEGLVSATEAHAAITFSQSLNEHLRTCPGCK